MSNSGHKHDPYLIIEDLRAQLTTERTLREAVERERDALREQLDISPINEPILFNNGEQCDMLIGPCACGATHRFEDIIGRVKSLREAGVKAVAAYASKLDETQQQRDALFENSQSQFQTEQALIAQLTAAQTALASAREDTARLDGLEATIRGTGQLVLNLDLGGKDIWCDVKTERPVCESTLRAALDAALALLGKGAA